MRRSGRRTDSGGGFTGCSDGLGCSFSFDSQSVGGASLQNFWRYARGAWQKHLPQPEHKSVRSVARHEHHGALSALNDVPHAEQST
jgi:hypothetical protein